MRTCDIFFHDGDKRYLNSTATSSDSGNAAVGISASIAAIIIGAIIFVLKKFVFKRQEPEKPVVAPPEAKPEEDKNLLVLNRIETLMDNLNTAITNNMKPQPEAFTPVKRSRKKRNTHRHPVKLVKAENRKMLSCKVSPIRGMPRIESDEFENKESSEEEKEIDYIKELSKKKQIAMSFCEDPECDCMRQYIKYDDS